MSTDTEIIEKKKTSSKEPKEPGKYNVVLMNDDKTPVEFVIALLINVFKHNQDSATQITLSVHNNGSGVAGTYTHEIAEQKAMDGTKLARANGFPLQIKIQAQ